MFSRFHAPLILVCLFSLLILSACGDHERRGRGGPVVLTECELACGQVYDTCGLVLELPGEPMPDAAACVQRCEAEEEFDGQAACLSEASCTDEAIDACLGIEGPTTPVGACAEEDAEWSDAWSAYEDEVVVEVNLRRAEGANCGGQVFGPAGPLVIEAALRCAARRHSADMSDRGYFDHVTPEGTTPFERIAAAEYRGGYPQGENVAYGYSTPKQVVDGWMTSPGHCKNIMEPDFREIGVGYVNTNPQMPHMWTQKFGGGRG